jgi:hypothetical protein
VKWEPDKRDFGTTIFPHGLLYSQINGATPLGLYGVGASFGVRASIIQSVFVGKPTVNVNDYHLLSPS